MPSKTLTPSKPVRVEAGKADDAGTTENPSSHSGAARPGEGEKSKGPKSKDKSKSGSKDKPKDKAKGKQKGKGRKKVKLTAATADRHVLYEKAVQNVESEIDFVIGTFKTLRHREPATLREDFCGTGNSSCEFVRRDDTKRAIGLDLDTEVLQWGRDNHVAKLTQEQQKRVRLVESDVRTPPRGARGTDCILAMNFSYWIFQEREALKKYFRSVRNALGDDGLFFLDHYSGSEAMTEVEERRKCGGYTYVWDQHRYNPVTGEMQCYIHFEFPDGTRQDKAFSYTWRLWMLPEIVDVLNEAGFSKVTVYCEGDDGDGGGDGEFEPATNCDADPSFITYIVAEK